MCNTRIPEPRSSELKITELENIKDMQRLRVAKIEEIDPFVKHIVLGPAEPDQELASFTPGQFISIAYQIDGSTCTRPYSLTSTPRDAAEGHYDIYLGKAGFTSTWAFENLKEGDIVYGSVPFGHFTYDPESGTKQIIGIAGGFSVTPLHSIAKAIVEGDLDAEMVLFSGWDHSYEIMLRDDYKEYSERSDKFKYIFIVADEAEASAMPDAEPGYISLDLIKKYAGHFDLDNAYYLVCGPQEMYEALDEELSSLAFPASHYKTEIPGEVKDSLVFPEYPAEKANETFTIHVYRGNCAGGEEIDIPALATETIEVALERAGLTYQARCRSGACGCCLSKMDEGAIFVPSRWDTRTDEELDEGLIHPCCSFPLSDIKLTLPLK